MNETTWPARGAFSLPVSLGAGDGTTGTLGPEAEQAGTVTTIVDNPGLSERNAIANPNTAVAGGRCSSPRRWTGTSGSAAPRR